MAATDRDRGMAPAARPAGFRVLIPGYPQWLWRQSERGAILGGTYLAAMAVGLFAWGSPLGLAMLGLGFFTHVASASDAIRQGAFPGFGRWVPTVSATAGLGLGCYGPAAAMGVLLAWPGGPLGADHERYAVNRCAFRSSDPQSGDWVWYRTPDGQGFGLGRLVGRSGQSVEWSSEGVRVDHQPLSWRPDAPDGEPLDLSMTVPDGQLLVSPMPAAPGTKTSCGLLLVARDGVVGRPWAQLYPVWTRRILF